MQGDEKQEMVLSTTGQTDQLESDKMVPEYTGRWAEGTIWDDNGKLLSGAQTYTDNTTTLKVNHPLMIMVKEQRVVRIVTKNIARHSGLKCCRAELAGAPTLHGAREIQMEHLWQIRLLFQPVSLLAIPGFLNRVHYQYTRTLHCQRHPAICQ